MFKKFTSYLKHIIIGDAKNPLDRSVFHNLSLIAFFAWVGLGADGLSSCVYGPSEAFIALSHHPYLSIFVALASAITIFVISASYSQIIELFPSGGGGYLVASKLLSPTLGMISGCALIIDYILTITISIASGADAIFSFLPEHFISYKLIVGILAIFVLTILNLRGAKESVMALVPIFLLFIFTHAFVIVYTFFTHLSIVPDLVQNTVIDLSRSRSELGMFGMFIVILKAYSMGAGTYTGIEAVSNGVSILREPRVQTGKRTMHYMAISLAFMVVGLMVAYLLYGVHVEPGKTLNATLLATMTASWPKNVGYIFVLVTLISEAVILFVAAQTGFMGGPRVLANMAIDRWFPTKFAMLSDRLITQNSVLFMGIGAIGMMILTKGSVAFLVVLYSINVFITFVLSLAGMTRHWISSRKKLEHWKRKLFVSFSGLTLCFFILVSMVVLKFHDGGWITLIITGVVIGISVVIKRHYLETAKTLKKFDKMIFAANAPNFIPRACPASEHIVFDSDARTAVMFVNGFTGIGLYTLNSIIDLFGNTFKNFVFIQVGLIDAGVFKGADAVDKLQEKSQKDVSKYVELMKDYGYYAEGHSVIGVDIVSEMLKMSGVIVNRFSHTVFFGGKLVFHEDTFFTRLLHNSMVLAIQRDLYLKGISFVILPVKVD
ncbi:MAG: APC family permease [Candidatus Margulisbacteria bacterium]|nr:APC family permease [Candidatus Margulisiibacteriota bacterium]